MSAEQLILVLGQDPALQNEFEDALAGQAEWGGRFVYVSEAHKAEEILRTRRPHLFCLDLQENLEPTLQLVRRAGELSPKTMIALLFWPRGDKAVSWQEPTLLSAVRSGVQDFLRRPVSSQELVQLLGRVRPWADVKAISRGKMICFASNKGGSGKTTLAVNTACTLAAKYPDQVLLIDLALQQGGGCAFLLDLQTPAGISDAAREWRRLDEKLLARLTVQHPRGLRILGAPRDALEAAEMEEHALIRIFQLASQIFQYVIIDTFPLLDNTVLSALSVSDEVCVVLQGTGPGVVAAQRFLPVLELAGVPVQRQRLILNQNYPSFAGNLSANDVEKQLKRALNHTFPFQKKILIAQNAGIPYGLQASRWSPFGRSLKGLARALETTNES